MVTGQGVTAIEVHNTDFPSRGRCDCCAKGLYNRRSERVVTAKFVQLECTPCMFYRHLSAIFREFEFGCLELVQCRPMLLPLCGSYVRSMLCDPIPWQWQAPEGSKLVMTLRLGSYRGLDSSPYGIPRGNQSETRPVYIVYICRLELVQVPTK